jgi:hypothetical protein
MRTFRQQDVVRFAQGSDCAPGAQPLDRLLPRIAVESDLIIALGA